MYIKIIDKEFGGSLFYEIEGSLGAYPIEAVFCRVEGFGGPGLLTKNTSFEIDKNGIHSVSNHIKPETPLSNKATYITFKKEDIVDDSYHSELFDLFYEISFTSADGKNVVHHCEEGTVYILNDNGKTIDKY